MEQTFQTKIKNEYLAAACQLRESFLHSFNTKFHTQIATYLEKWIHAHAHEMTLITNIDYFEVGKSEAQLLQKRQKIFLGMMQVIVSKNDRSTLSSFLKQHDELFNGLMKHLIILQEEQIINAQKSKKALKNYVKASVLSGGI